MKKIISIILILIVTVCMITACSTEADRVYAKIEDKSIDMILCDLPHGSTGVACINTNRNFIDIEKDANYFSIAQKRISEVQGNG